MATEKFPQNCLAEINTATVNIWHVQQQQKIGKIEIFTRPYMLRNTISFISVLAMINFAIWKSSDVESSVWQTAVCVYVWAKNSIGEYVYKEGAGGVCVCV